MPIQGVKLATVEPLSEFKEKAGTLLVPVWLALRGTKMPASEEEKKALTVLLSERFNLVPDAPPCPSCGDPIGTPLNVECGVEPGRFHGPEDSNLKCPSCGTGWKGSDIEVADAWRAFVEFEKTMIES